MTAKALHKFNKYNQFVPAYSYEQNQHYSMGAEYMAQMKMDLMWLYTNLEVKGHESEKRGKPMSDEYKLSIDTVKRASLFITNYCRRIEELYIEVAELKRRNEYLTKQLPKVEWKNMIAYVDRGDIKYRKRTDKDIPLGVLLQQGNDLHNSLSHDGY